MGQMGACGVVRNDTGFVYNGFVTPVTRFQLQIPFSVLSYL